MAARLTLLLAVVLLLAAACGSNGDPPPRNPLDDTTISTPTASPSTPPATATATPAVTATPSGDGASAPDERALEVFTGNAIELLAEWLGVPFTDLRVDSAEALVWPNACLGIDQPGVACAEILTPGFRVVLRDAFDGVHAIHGSTLGQARWRGEATASGTIAAVREGSITIAGDDGERVLLASPGTSIEGPEGRLGLDSIAPGLRVIVGFDTSPTGSAIPVLAWLLVTEGS